MMQQNRKWNGVVNVITANTIVTPEQLVNEIRHGSENITIRLPSVEAVRALGDIVTYLFYVAATGAGTIAWAVGTAAIDPDVGWTGTGGGNPAFSEVDPTNPLETKFDTYLVTYYYGKCIVRTAESNA